MVRPLSMLSVVVAVLLPLLPAPGAAQAPVIPPPVVDGNLDDLLSFAEATAAGAYSCALVVEDPAADIRSDDPGVVPCITSNIPGYFQNGFDQLLAVAALDWGTLNGDLYLGMRVVGRIGDPDGNGDPGVSCVSGTIPDPAGIGPRDVYRWELDTTCNADFTPDLWVEVTGDPEHPGQALVRTSGLSIASYEIAFQGDELEVVLRHAFVDSWHMLLEPTFTVRATADNLDDTLAPDAGEVARCPEPELALTVDTYFDVDKVCPGDTVLVSGAVFNWSLVTVWEVNAVDLLPEGWTYVPGSAVRIGEPAVDGERLTFPAFPLWPVEGVWFYFRAVVPPDADGPQVNRLSATMSQTGSCVEGGRRTFGPVEDEAQVLARAPRLALDVTARDGSGTVAPSFAITVRNTSSYVEAVEVECDVNGDPVPFEGGTLDPGESLSKTLELPCAGPAASVLSCTARAALVDTPYCAVEAARADTAYCLEPCVGISPLTAGACSGTAGIAQFSVSSCAAREEDLVLNGTRDGVALEPIVVQGLPPGGTREIAVPVTCTGESISFQWTANVTRVGALTGWPGILSFSFSIPCATPQVAISREHDPGVDGTARVTLTVANTGTSSLDPVNVTDRLGPELAFSELVAGEGTCDVEASSESAGGTTLLRFTGVTLEPGDSCTIVYTLLCTQLGMGDTVTARAEAWCAGSQGLTDPVTDEASDFVSCNGLECPAPQHICFWRVQADRDPGDPDGEHGKDDNPWDDDDGDAMCPAAFAALSRCVLAHATVEHFERRNGAWDTLEELAALDDDDLAERLAYQLDGDQYNFTRDYAEGQYLTLLYNICAGLVSPSTPLVRGGTVGDVLAGLAQALDTETAMDTWRVKVCEVNNRQGLVLPSGCDPETCDMDDHGDDDHDDHGSGAGLAGTADEDIRCCRPLVYGYDASHDECCGTGTCGGRDLGIRLGLCGESGEGSAIADGTDAVILAAPNPVLGTETQILFRVPEALGAERCLVEVYDVTGKRVRCLAEEPMGGGAHEVRWDLRNEAGGKVANGIYFTSLRVGAVVRSSRVLVIPQ